MTAPKDRGVDPHPLASSKGRVLTVSLRRVRRGRAVAFTPDEPKPEPPPKPCPSRAAQMLALAHEFQKLIDDGEVPDRATLAAEVGLTRARVTQILDLLLLAPDIQEDVLMGIADLGHPEPTERHLRNVTWHRCWREQRIGWSTNPRSTP